VGFQDTPPEDAGLSRVMPVAGEWVSVPAAPIPAPELGPGIATVPPVPILDGAECSQCDTVCESAVIGNESWNRCDETGAILCPDCSSTCEDCGHVLAPDCMSEDVDGRCVSCARNYEACSGCSDITHQDDLRSGYCESCREDMICCEGCGQYVQQDSSQYHEGTDCYYCESCYPARESRLIHDYGYRPDPEFRRAEGSPTFNRSLPAGHYGRTRRPIPSGYMYLGVEIEVEATRGADVEEGAETVPTDRYYCKHDGSLSNGFEIVSHPATWEWWRTADLGFTDTLREMGFRSYNTDTCGMHVHVSRNVLSQLDIYKLLKFCKNAPGFLLKVSRRKKANLERWAAIGREDPEVLVLKAKGGLESPACRYEALNVTGSATVEFRLFRGTLDKVAIKRNLAFVQALILYCKETSIKRLSSSLFRKWLQERGGELIGMNHARGLLESFKPEEVKDNVFDSVSA